MTTTRTDIHRPVEFDPEAYVNIGYFDNGVFDREPTAETWMEAQEALEYVALLSASKAAGQTRYGTGRQCDHCGAHIRYVAVYRHAPTGAHIAVGEQCAEGRFHYSKAEFQRLRKAAALNAELAKVRAEWAAYKVANADVDWDALYASTNDFVQDVLRKGARYGNISDRQRDAIVAAVVRDAEREAQRAEREALALPPMPVPEGNGLAIEGIVLATRWDDGYYGSTYKMLVEVTVEGGVYRLWGSVPAAIDPDKGDVVRFVANVERSSDDEAFGFYKRPRKAEVVA